MNILIYLATDLLLVSLALFTIGLSGLVFCGRHLILIVICFELMLVGLASVLIFLSIFTSVITGQILSLFLLCLAGVESAFGLALFLIVFKNYNTIESTIITFLRH